MIFVINLYNRTQPQTSKIDTVPVLFMLFVFVCVQWCPTLLCCVFILCSFVLCTLCLQFLWIVHISLPLLYSLTFIYLVISTPVRLSYKCYIKNNNAILSTLKCSYKQFYLSMLIFSVFQYENPMELIIIYLLFIFIFFITSNMLVILCK